MTMIMIMTNLSITTALTTALTVALTTTITITIYKKICIYYQIICNQNFDQLTLTLTLTLTLALDETASSSWRKVNSSISLITNIRN